MKFSGTLIAMGSSGGAILGGSISGPVGALIGAFAGATISLVAGDEELSSSKKKPAKRKGGGLVYSIRDTFTFNSGRKGSYGTSVKMRYHKTDENVK